MKWSSFWRAKKYLRGRSTPETECYFQTSKNEQLREIQELTDLLSFELKKVPNIHMLLLEGWNWSLDELGEIDVLLSVIEL